MPNAVVHQCVVSLSSCISALTQYTVLYLRQERIAAVGVLARMVGTEWEDSELESVEPVVEFEDVDEC